jgi:SNF2 family DNA or RNA helicase
MTLLPQQKSALNKINKVKVGALFMEPGTGKTRVAYNLVNLVKNIDYLLYLAPYRLINSANDNEGIKHEISKCGGFNFHVDYVGIESLSNSDRLYLQLIESISKSKKPFIICDESIKIKNIDAIRTQRIIALGKMAEYKLVLNGTPLTRNLLDLWAQMQFLSPNILGMGYNEFVDSFVEYSVVSNKLNSNAYKNLIIKDYHNIDYLYSLIEHFVFQSNLDISVNKRKIEVEYTIDNELKEDYRKLKDYFLSIDTLDSMDNNIFLAMTQKLQQSYSCSSSKIKVVKSIISKHKDVLIFCKYDKSEALLKSKFPNSRILKYGKHSYGLNLQDYNCTIFFDKTFDYGQLVQAENRTYRTGQKNTCYYYNLTGDVPLENLINSNIERKTDLLDYFKTIIGEKWAQKNILKRTFINLL